MDAGPSLDHDPGDGPCVWPLHLLHSPRHIHRPHPAAHGAQQDPLPGSRRRITHRPCCCC